MHIFASLSLTVTVYAECLLSFSRIFISNLTSVPTVHSKTASIYSPLHNNQLSKFHRPSIVVINLREGAGSPLLSLQATIISNRAYEHTSSSPAFPSLPHQPEQQRASLQNTSPIAHRSSRMLSVLCVHLCDGPSIFPEVTYCPDVVHRLSSSSAHGKLLTVKRHQLIIFHRSCSEIITTTRKILSPSEQPFAAHHSLPHQPEIFLLPVF